MSTCEHGAEIGLQCEQCLKRYHFLTVTAVGAEREKHIARIFHLDPPEGEAWICTTEGCGSWATIGGNAAFHAKKLGHNVPYIDKIPKPDKAKSYRLVLVDPDGREHTVVRELTGDTDDAYMERRLDDGSTEWWDPTDLIDVLKDIEIKRRSPEKKG